MVTGVQTCALPIFELTDATHDTLGARVRKGKLEKIPYLLVVGDREAEADEVSVRRHRVGDEGTASIDAFADRLFTESYTRAR